MSTVAALRSRTFAIIAVTAALGAASALVAFRSTHGLREDGQLRALVWTVFATPLLTAAGWIVARRQQAWEAAFSCWMVYFFSLFIAARIERLVLGAEAATNSGHRLYFLLVIALQLVASVALALRAARPAGTIPAAPSQPLA